MDISQSADGFQEEEGQNFSPETMRAALLILSPGPHLSVRGIPSPYRRPSGGSPRGVESSRADLGSHISEDRRGAQATTGEKA